jgi:CO/xanthine dehydrogenase FAD-binding subunit
MSTLIHLAPRDRSELVEALARMTGQSRLLAGGTDLVREMTKNGLRPDLLVDLNDLDELRGVGIKDGVIRIGALTTFARLQEDPVLRRHGRCIADAAASVGSVQIRSAATIGGNVANASPCGDSIPALLALEAKAEIWDAADDTELRPIADVVTGAGRTSLAPGQVIAAFVFPVPDERWLTAFAKVGSRSAVTVARLSAAVAVEMRPDGRSIGEARVALGAVGETAFRDPLVESVLAGGRSDARMGLRFAEACCDAVCRSIPGRYSLGYKCRAAAGLADDVWRGLGFASPAEPAGEG